MCACAVEVDYFQQALQVFLVCDVNSIIVKYFMYLYAPHNHKQVFSDKKSSCLLKTDFKTLARASGGECKA